MAESLSPGPALADFPDLVRAALLPASPPPEPRLHSGRLVGPFPGALQAWLDHDPELVQLAGDDLPVTLRPGPVGVQQGLLGAQHSPQPERRPLLTENQGVVRWSLAAVPGEDPPVEVKYMAAVGGSRWRPCAPTFSAFAWARRWDLAPAAWRAEAADHPVQDEVIAALGARFPAGPETRTWPRARTLRHTVAEARLTVGADADGVSDWTLAAGSQEALQAALEALAPLLPRVLLDRLQESVQGP